MNNSKPLVWTALRNAILSKHTLLIGGCAAVLVAAGLTGCGYLHEREGRQTGRTGTQVADDKHISERVRTSLRISPVYKFADVGVNTFDRVVQLNGFVQTEDQKRAAEDIARQAPGAVRVINDIEVQQSRPIEARTAPPHTPVPTGREAPTGTTTDNQSGS